MPPNYDYNLLESSPAVDGGMVLPGVGSDLRHAIRPQGSAYDIGALESSGTRSVGSLPTNAPPADTSSLPDVAAGGYVTYTFGNSIYRIRAGADEQPENLSLVLAEMIGPGVDDDVSMSPNGDWLLISTERGDPECGSWACLVLVDRDLESLEYIRVDGELFHGGDKDLISSDGKLIVYTGSAGDGSHERDLWAIDLEEDVWSIPRRLTAASTFDWNDQPSISDDGRSVLFDCGQQPYAQTGTAICEVGTDGTGFRVILTPSDGPPGVPKTGALHHPDYSDDGSIVFEADWDGEQIWRLSQGSKTPTVLGGETFTNDNSPCVLPDGRVVSLWMEYPDSGGIHELKLMNPDGSSFMMILTGVDISDDGLDCSA